MSFKNSRYVIEIDLPEGYLSIDCEIEYGEENRMTFFLNQSSVNKERYLPENSSELKKQLLDYNDFEFQTERDDIENMLNELMLKEFGADADILIRDVDSD